MATDTISIDTATKIDIEWTINGMNANGLRLVHTKRDSLLTVPSLNGAAPTYQFKAHDPETGVYAPGYYHVSGPTLVQWQAQREYAEARRETSELRAWAGGR